MKKYLLLFIPFLLFCSGEINAQVSARMVDGSNSWWYFQTQKLESKIELYGLLYETTLDVKIKLANGYRDGSYCQEPYHGKNEIEWALTLPQNDHIKH